MATSQSRNGTGPRSEFGFLTIAARRGLGS